jgi:hypothetical protein
VVTRITYEAMKEENLNEEDWNKFQNVKLTNTVKPEGGNEVPTHTKTYSTRGSEVMCFVRASDQLHAQFASPFTHLAEIWESI